MPKARPGRTRRLEVGEYDKLKAAAASDPNPRIEAVMDLAIETAMRLGEILSARRRQIHGSVLVLREEDTKTSKSRAVPLSTRA